MACHVFDIDNIKRHTLKHEMKTTEAETETDTERNRMSESEKARDDEAVPRIKIINNLNDGARNNVAMLNTCDRMQ